MIPSNLLVDVIKRNALFCIICCFFSRVLERAFRGTGRYVIEYRMYAICSCFFFSVGSDLNLLMPIKLLFAFLTFSVTWVLYPDVEM